jgi:quercetin dioxygenase-like cupin family protein
VANNEPSHEQEGELTRKHFLQHLAAAPFACGAAAYSQSNSGLLKKPGMVPKNAGTPLWVLGMLVTLKADSRMTGGAYAVFENVVPPGRGVPLHVHTREDETLYLLDGELEVVLGEKTEFAATGDFVNMPRGIPHRFRNVGSRAANLLLSFTPGGLEQMFVDVGTPVAASPDKAPEVTPEDIRKARKLAEKYGGRWL